MIILLAMFWAGIGVALAMRQGHAHGSEFKWESLYIRTILGGVTGPLFPLFFPIRRVK